MRFGKFSSSHLDELPKEPSIDVVVCLHEDLPETGLSDRVVLCIELVKAVERVAVLKQREAQPENFPHTSVTKR